ncbi:MAG: FtsX-like permease family protein [Acidimicrobiia bacterium]|nr:FtsX-like permease family protein [Acidimicrobiia bacterium]
MRRNLLVVVGAILAVFVSLTLAFGALAFNEVVRVNTLAWQDGVHIIAFLNDPGANGVAPDAHERLTNDVKGWSEVDTVRYVDKAGAWAEFQELFQDRPDILELGNQAQLPASLRIELTDIDLHDSVRLRLAQEQQLVSRVSVASNAIQQISQITSVLNVVGIGLSIILGIAAVVLIANTIRLAIYARRDEISIMKLVGASNWFVRVPFVLEGMIEGVVGAALAVFSVWVAARPLMGSVSQVEWFQITLSSGFFLRWGVIFVLFGAVAGILGSFLGLSRYLKEAEGTSTPEEAVPELV